MIVTKKSEAIDVVSDALAQMPLANLRRSARFAADHPGRVLLSGRVSVCDRC